MLIVAIHNFSSLPMVGVFTDHYINNG